MQKNRLMNYKRLLLNNKEPIEFYYSIGFKIYKLNKFYIFSFLFFKSIKAISEINTIPEYIAKLL